MAQREPTTRDTVLESIRRLRSCHRVVYRRGSHAGFVVAPLNCLFPECRAPDFCHLEGATCEKAAALRNTISEIERMRQHAWRMALFCMFMAAFVIVCLIRMW